MLYILIRLFSMSLLLPVGVLQTQSDPATPGPGPTILSPSPGQALQGIVPITGNIAVQGFQSAEISFTYQGDPRQTWFLIGELNSPVAEGHLLDWDTTTITDGEYSLNLAVTMESGEVLTTTVEGLRVRNYSPIETDTPYPTATPAPGDTTVPTTTPTSSGTPIPFTPTPLPTNPAIITTRDVTLSLGKGVLAVVGMFALIGLYQVTRGIARRRRE